MIAALSHEMSQVNCLNSKMYTKARCDPWRRVHNLFVVVCSLFELLKEAPIFSRIVSKLFEIGD
jgi:hypothetical protein